MSACPLQHGAGGRVQRPSNQSWTKPISRHPRASRTTTAKSPAASREPPEMPRNPTRESARASARSGAGFRGIYGGCLEAPGLVAVVVRDALGCLLMGLVHGWLLGRCTLPQHHAAGGTQTCTQMSVGMVSPSLNNTGVYTHAAKFSLATHY